jgi:peptidoglycan/LPS O-acetylase OafA/YrhL
MPELDSVRGIAILLVVVFHGFAGAYFGLHFGELPDRFVRATYYGFTGVNLFFVLSGFLITGILLDSKHKERYYRDFYVRRALRILPAYYLLLILLILLGSGTAAYFALSFFYLSNVTDLFGVAFGYGPLWSLAVEEHYYLIWPALVRNLSRRNLAICATGVWLAVPCLRWAYFGRVHSEGLGTYTWFCADNLAAGSQLAIFLRGSITRRVVLLISSGLVVLGITLAGIAGWYGVAQRTHLAGAVLGDSVLSVLFTGMLALFLLAGSSSWQWLVTSRILRFFGYISYSLYLFQMMVAGLYDRMGYRFLAFAQPRSGRFDLAVFRFLMTTAFAISLAYLSRRYFEEFFLRFKNRFSGELTTPLNPDA